MRFWNINNCVEWRMIITWKEEEEKLDSFSSFFGTVEGEVFQGIECYKDERK